MHVGDIEDEILDADRNVVGYITRRGVEGLPVIEWRHWRQLYLRRLDERKEK